MNLMHEQVNHLKFGAGTVTAQDPSTVTVKFSEEYGSKKFLYPSAFQSFLELCNSSVKEQMGSELKSIQTRAEVERARRALEKEKLRALLEASKKPVKKRVTKKAPAKKSADTNEEDTK